MASQLCTTQDCVTKLDATRPSWLMVSLLCSTPDCVTKLNATRPCWPWCSFFWRCQNGSRLALRFNNFRTPSAEKPGKASYTCVFRLWSCLLIHVRNKFLVAHLRESTLFLAVLLWLYSGCMTTELLAPTCEELNSMLLISGTLLSFWVYYST